MDATAIYVAYRTETIDCRWIPDAIPVIVVHNDQSLDRDGVRHPGVRHLVSAGNVGFGAAVNRAAAEATTQRLVLCNPDTVLQPAHWLALDGQPDEVVTVPLVDDYGIPTSVIAPYWTPLALAGTTLRLGARLAPLGSRRRRLLSRSKRGWLGRQDRNLRSVPDETAMTSDPASWPLGRRWVSGAVMSIDRDRMLSVGGFDTRFFLYFEDTDLCRRLARRHPTMRARMAATDPGIHTVGGTGAGTASVAVRRLRRRAAVTYGATQDGWQWLPYRLVDRILDRRIPVPTATRATSSSPSV